MDKEVVIDGSIRQPLLLLRINERNPRRLEELTNTYRENPSIKLASERLPNEITVGSCKKDPRVKSAVEKVFNILTQPDLKTFIIETKPEFILDEEYFDFDAHENLGCGAWQSPTQMYHFKTDRYIGTVTRQSFVGIEDYNSGLHDDTYGVAFRLHENLEVKYSSIEELGSKAQKPIIHLVSVSPPYFEIEEIRKYGKENGPSIDPVPYIPYRMIEQLKATNICAPDPGTLKITIGSADLDFKKEIAAYGGTLRESIDSTKNTFQFIVEFDSHKVNGKVSEGSFGFALN